LRLCGDFLLDRGGRRLVRYFGRSPSIVIPSQVVEIGTSSFSKGLCTSIAFEEG
jgi:hypothetical protein